MSSANDVVCAQGVTKEWKSGQFRYLAQVLDAYGERCPKADPDHLVWQLQSSYTGVLCTMLSKRYIVLMGLHAGGATSSRKTDDLSYEFRYVQTSYAYIVYGDYLRMRSSDWFISP